MVNRRIDQTVSHEDGWSWKFLSSALPESSSTCLPWWRKILFCTLASWPCIDIKCNSSDHSDLYVLLFQPIRSVPHWSTFPIQLNTTAPPTQAADGRVALCAKCTSACNYSGGTFWDGSIILLEFCSGSEQVALGLRIKVVFEKVNPPEISALDEEIQFYILRRLIQCVQIKFQSLKPESSEARSTLPFQAFNGLSSQEVLLLTNHR